MLIKALRENPHMSSGKSLIDGAISDWDSLAKEKGGGLGDAKTTMKEKGTYYLPVPDLAASQLLRASASFTRLTAPPSCGQRDRVSRLHG